MQEQHQLMSRLRLTDLVAERGIHETDLLPSYLETSHIELLVGPRIRHIMDQLHETKCDFVEMDTSENI
jgi:hypothetical protein